MRRSAIVFSIVLAIGALILGPWAGAQAQDGRERGTIEIEKCQTISKPGSYELTNNLAVANSDCPVITADLVTIDLAGFSITETHRSSFCGETAIAAGEDRRGITVRNGSISGFGTGVDLGGEGSVVEGLRLFGDPGLLGIAAKGVVKGNIVDGFGCVLESGNGIVATGIVTGNYVAGNQRGIFIGEGSTVIGNTVTNNPHGGIIVSCPSNVTNNTAVNNGRLGLPGGNIVFGGEGCTDTNNVAP